MAAPVIESVLDTQTQTVPFAASLPSGVTEGDLLIAVVQVDCAPGATYNITTASGWTQLYHEQDNEDYAVGAVWYKEAGASEPSTFTVAGTTTRAALSRVYRISGAEAISTQAPEYSIKLDTGNSTTHNPPSITPTGGSKDYLYLALCHLDTYTPTFTGFPTGYTSTGRIQSGATGSECQLGYGVKSTTGSSTEDPSTFTVSATRRAMSVTLAIHPVGTAGDTISPSLTSESVSIFNPSLAAGAVTLSPSLVSSAATVLNAAVSSGPYVISPSLVSEALSVYNTALLAGVAIVSPDTVSAVVTAFQASLLPGLVTISPDLTSEGVVVQQPSVAAAIATVSANITSALATVNNPSLTAGAVTLSPALVSHSISVLNAAISSVTLISPDSTTATATVNQISTSLLYSIVANLTSLTATVEQPAIPYEQFISPNLISEAALVQQPRMLTGDIINPDTSTAVVNVASVSLQSGSVTILPLVVSLTSDAYNPRLFDPATFVAGFYSNDTMIEYFRQQTGLDSYQFNELAKAYYEQVSAIDPEAFNESLIAAQKAAGFVGLAPTDWRNY